MSTAKYRSRKSLAQWLVKHCECEEAMAKRVSKHFTDYYSEFVQGTRLPMESEVQAKNIVLAFMAGYIQGINDHE